MRHKSIRSKANRVLQIISATFFLIAVRVWYLSTIAYDEHVELAKKPQVRTVIEQANRGTIRDRFNIPLAVNKISYDVAITYDPIRRLPRTKWEKDETGQKVKIFYRTKYIEELSEMLADALTLQAKDIEDVIYSKAALFPNTPFTLKENVSESLFYKMKMMERQWPGLDMQINARRHYPSEEIGGSIIGYMGAISGSEHLRIHNELEILNEFVKAREEGLPIALPKGFRSALEVKERLAELKERSYTINSRVGKSGIEGKFDEDLRGFFGKKKYEVDVQGHYLRELPESYEAIPGRRILLSISSELQAYAESLLAQSEISREERFSVAGKGHSRVNAPWIKGGAIVAMIPTTGEVVALASYPRFNPNDFTSSTPVLNMWLENVRYIADIWDGVRPLHRDFSGALKPRRIQEKQDLTWEHFLKSILSNDSTVKVALDQIATVQNAISLQVCMDQILQYTLPHSPLEIIDTLFRDAPHKPSIMKTENTIIEKIKKNLEEHFDELTEYIAFVKSYLSSVPYNDDKLLTLDLCRLCVQHQLFDPALIPRLEQLTLGTYRSVNQSVNVLGKEMRRVVEELFHMIDFPKWRETYFTSYLKEKRLEEKRNHTYQKPYADYLEEMEGLLFQKFYQENQLSFLHTFITGINQCSQKDPAYPYHVSLLRERERALATDKHLASHLHKLGEHLVHFTPAQIDAYLVTMRSFDDLARPLWGRYYFPAKPGRHALEKDLARHFYPATGYGYARSYAYQETAPQGSIFKVITAYEALRQHYESMKDTHYQYDLNPLTIIDECRNPRDTSAKAILGYTMAGIPITRHYKGGRLPRSHKSIGKVDLMTAIEQSSNIYFSLLASDVIADPLDLTRCSKDFGLASRTGIDLTGEVGGLIPHDIVDNQSGLYSFAIGQHSLTVTPLQTALYLSTLANKGVMLKPQIVKYVANMEPSSRAESCFPKSHYTYEELLNRVGIYFPFFTEAQKKQETPYLCKKVPEVKRRLHIPDIVHETLFSALYKVTNGSKGPGRVAAIRTLYEHPNLKRVYEEVRPFLLGKTGTAEILHRPVLDREYKPFLSKHIWFGGIAFEPNETQDEAEIFKDPELVVVVYLRYGDYGKETIPLAAAMIKKWREICEKHEMNEMP